MGNYRLTKSISLIGLMGAGKTAVGRALATELDCPFADSDAVIVEEAGLTIAEIFEIAGEAKFREMEQRTIAKLLSGSPLILSTGGGAFCQDETHKIIQQNSTSLWVYAPPATLLARMSKPLKRPLLQVDDPLSVLTELSESREAYYSKAALKVDTDGCSLNQATLRVLETLKQSGIIAMDDAGLASAANQ